MVEDGLRPALEEQAAGEPPVAGGACVLPGLVGQVVGEVPQRGEAVEADVEVGVPQAQAGTQQRPEQGVVAVRPVLVELDEEDPPPLERRQPAAGGGVAGQRHGEVGGEAGGDARAQEELLRGLVLPVEHLGQQVVRHRDLRRRGAEHEAAGLGVRPQGAGGEAQAGRPALGPLAERPGVVATEADAVAGEQLARLVRPEAEVGVADLAEPALDRQASPAQRRVGPAGQHEVERGRCLVDEVLHGPQRTQGGQLVEVVEHEDAMGAPADQVLEDHVEPVVARLRGQLVQPGERTGPFQRHHDEVGQPAGLVVPPVDGQPADRPERGAVEPTREKGRLAGPRRRADQRDLAARVVGEQGLEPWPAYEAVR